MNILHYHTKFTEQAEQYVRSMFNLSAHDVIHMPMKQLSHIDFLTSEFEARKSRNKGYSLRAFARDLEISPSRLSEIMSGAGISENMASKIAENLGLKSSESKIFLNIIQSKFSKSPRKKMQAIEDLKKSSSDESFTSLSLDGFQLISEWYYFAILATMELTDFNGDANWIAQRLGLDPQLVRSALEKLLRLDLVTINGSKFELSKSNLTTTHDIASFALRKSHRQTLAQASEALDNVPVELRDITSMTMSIDKNKIKQAKELIKKFRRDLSEYLESGEKNSVYNLNIQLVPLTKEEL